MTLRNALSAIATLALILGFVRPLSAQDRGLIDAPARDMTAVGGARPWLQDSVLSGGGASQSRQTRIAMPTQCELAPNSPGCPQYCDASGNGPGCAVPPPKTQLPAPRLTASGP